MKHNFSDTPSDNCDVCKRSENIEHFFLYCTRYIEARRTLLYFVQTLNVYVEQLQPRDKIKLLLGETSFSDAINKSLLKVTLTFLRESERFL